VIKIRKCFLFANIKKNQIATNLFIDLRKIYVLINEISSSFYQAILFLYSTIEEMNG